MHRFDATGLPCDIGGQVDAALLAPPDPTDAIGGSAWRMLRTAAQEAEVHAAVAGLPDPRRIAVYMGGHGCTPLPGDVAAAARHSAPRADRQGYDIDLDALAADPHYDSNQGTRRSPETAPLLLAQSVGARGPVVPFVSACTAGTQAIGEGMRLLRAGEADLVIAGGAEPFLHFTYFVGFALLGALTRRYKDPKSASRPFDRKRNGFVIAEGAAVLVLETLAQARSRARPILGEVLGYGDSADGYRITDPHPKGDGAVAAMSGALASAGRAPQDVGYVNAHGTSTAINDPVETLAIKRVFGEHAATIPVSSNKSMLGHAIGAAGAIEAVLTLEGMRQGVVLPTRNHDAPDRRCDLDYVPHKARDVPHRVALSNSFAFGGQNGSLCLGAAPEEGRAR